MYLNRKLTRHIHLTERNFILESIKSFVYNHLFIHVNTNLVLLYVDVILEVK